MREILFRGKRDDNLAWIEGYIYCITENQEMPFLMIKDYHGITYPVYPDTVGQFTGLIDKNGKPIFEGDIVKLRLLAAKMEWKGVCEYRNGAFGLAWQYAGERYCTFAGTCNAEYEVLGNIHDNPERMEDE